MFGMAKLNSISAAVSAVIKSIAISHNQSPYITVYNRSGDTFTKIANPGTLPSGQGMDAAWSPDGVYLAVVTDPTPFIHIYKRSGDTLTKLSNPGTLPTGYGTACAWSPDGVYLAVGHGSTPFMTVYKRSGDTFTKLTNPTNLPNGAVGSMKFNHNGTSLAITTDTSPYIIVYNRSGDVFTRLALFSTPLSGYGAYSGNISWNHDNTRLTACSDGTPSSKTYSRSGDTFTALSTLPSLRSVRTATWSPDGSKLALGTAFGTGTNYLQIYGSDNTLITEFDIGVTNAPIKDIKWNSDASSIAISLGVSPYIKVYNVSGTTYTAVSAPATLPAGNGGGLSWFN